MEETAIKQLQKKSSLEDAKMVLQGQQQIVADS